MPLSDVLDALRARATRRHETAGETVWAAAKRLAAGESANPEQVEAALAEAGLQLDDFDGLVKLAGQRREWFAALDRATPARTKFEKLKATMEAERAAFDDMCRRWQERAAAADAELAEFERVMREGDAARDALCRPGNLPPATGQRMQAALDDQHAAVVAVEDAKRQLREQREIEHRREWMAAQKREGGRWHPLDIDEDERAAKRAGKRAAELEQEIRTLEVAVRAADDNVDKCRASALKT
jgi:hypothetical protein